MGRFEVGLFLLACIPYNRKIRVKKGMEKMGMGNKDGEKKLVEYFGRGKRWGWSTVFRVRKKVAGTKQLLFD